MRIRFEVAALLASLVGACSSHQPTGGSSNASGETQSAAGEPASCQAQVAAMREWLAPLRDDQAYFAYSRAAELVEMPGTQRPPRGPVIELSKRGYRLMGDRVAWHDDPKFQELRESLAQHQRTALLATDDSRSEQREGFGPHRHLLLAISPDVPWRRVVAIADVAKTAGYSRMSFVFKRASKATPPPHSAVTDQLEALRGGDDAGTKALNLSNIAETVIAKCKPLAVKMVDVAGTDASQKAVTIIDLVPDALLACQCNGLPEMRSLLYAVLQLTPEWAITVAVEPSTSPSVITAAANKTWKDVAPQLAPLVSNEPPIVEFVAQ